MAASNGYNWKSITVVPNAGELVDIVLSKTQRKTPTVVHKGYAIHRIRSFYMRKVKFTQQTIHDKLSAMLTEFPDISSCHPFYADLMNVLYDKDHFKLALGQMNTARHLIDGIAKEYNRLLKFADSQYRCKQLKRAALGRMMTLLKRMNSSLKYLEQVRQHLSRLPSIDVSTRSLVLCGFPNVGKSSFINKVTRADVDVQPYAFTTKSLFVGHTDYKYLPWQIIDTPGILDHPLDEMNTIEMQAVTALAHLRAAILFFMDLSEMCGYPVAHQLSLFENIRPLFANKPVMIVLNKTDVLSLEQASPEIQATMAKYQEEGIQVLQMSALTEEGVAMVRNAACDTLLASRLTTKGQAKVNDIQHRLHLATPVPRDDKSRPPCIPANASLQRSGRRDTPIHKLNPLAAAEAAAARMKLNPEELKKLQHDIELELGEDYKFDMKGMYQLKDDEWKYDKIPEIMDGKNIADFIDPEIMQKLRQLEVEEEARELAGDYADDLDDETEERTALRATAAKVRQRKLQMALLSRAKRSKNTSNVGRSALAKAKSRILATRGAAGETTDVTKLARSRSIGPNPGDGKRERSSSAAAGPRTRSQSRPGRDQIGISSTLARAHAAKLKRLGQRPANRLGKAGEADRQYKEKMPKHLFAGKRPRGTADRR